MTRAVLDTNAVVSALVFKQTAFPLVAAWQQQRFVWLVSPRLLAEYIRVLHYPKFRLTQSEVRHLVEEELVPFITAVKVTKTPRVIRADPADNHMLACAVAGKADVIVSGDHHVLRLRRYQAIPIVTLAEFLQRIEHS